MTSAPEKIEAAWTAEIRERLAEVRAGKADLVDWAVARVEIKRKAK